MACINSLPDEILVHLFMMFSVRDLGSILAFVCSNWHRITRTPKLWQQVEVQVSLCSAIRLFHTAPVLQMRELTISEWEGTSVDVIVSLVATHCPRLTKFKIRAAGNDTMKLNDASLETLASFCPELTELDLGANGFIVSRNKTYEVLARFPQLKVLSLGLGSDWYGEIPDLRNNLTNLRIAIYTSGATTNMINPFLKKHQSILTQLQINVVKWSHMQDSNLASILDLPHLTELEIEMTCDPTKLTENGFISAFSTRATIHNLKKLCLQTSKYSTTITDEVATAIANNCPQLISLQLNRCTPVTDHGILEIVSQCHRLQHLLLPGLSNLTKQSLGAIRQWLPHLRQLDITKCNIERESVLEFVAACPQMKVVVDEEDGDESDESIYLQDDFGPPVKVFVKKAGDGEHESDESFSSEDESTSSDE